MAQAETKPQAPARVGASGGGGQVRRALRPRVESVGQRVGVSARSDDPGYGGLVESSDVIIVTVPIHQTVSVIERISPLLRPEQLLSDFTSVKGEAVAAMLATRARVIGCHPIFGPMPDPAGQNVVLCPARPGGFLDWFRGFLTRHGMKVVEMSAESHDRAMAFVQGLTHFINITFARTLQTRQANLEEILKVCSPVYQVLFSILCRILSGDANLYGQIQISNRDNLPVLADFLRNSEELLEAIDNSDAEAVYRMFNESAEYLGDYKAVARKNSDFLIDRMTEFLTGGRPNER